MEFFCLFFGRERGHACLSKEALVVHALYFVRVGGVVVVFMHQPPSRCGKRKMSTFFLSFLLEVFAPDFRIRSPSDEIKNNRYIYIREREI